MFMKFEHLILSTSLQNGPEKPSQLEFKLSVNISRLAGNFQRAVETQ